MNTIAELKELIELAEPLERPALENALRIIEGLHRNEGQGFSQDDLEVLAWNVRTLHLENVPREEWTQAEVMYEAYYINGNVLGSGADLPGTARPIRVSNPEDYGFATTYEIDDVEVNVE